MLIDFVAFNFFALFTVLFFLLSGQLRSVLVLLLVGVFIVFFFPAWYIQLGGEKYKSYGDDAYKLFLLFGILSYLQVLLALGFKLIFDRIVWRDRSGLNLKFIDARFVVFFVFIFLLFYVVGYWGSWPLVNALHGQVVDRPDIVKGEFRGYFLFSFVVNVVVPSLFFFFYNSLSKLFLLVAYAFLSALLLLGGNKGILLYFFLFNVIFVWQGVSGLKLGLVFFVLIFSYAVIRAPFLEDGVHAYYLFESIIERVFLTQGMAIPALFELHLAGADITQWGSNELKYRLFEFVYGYSPGSMPVFYTAEIYVRFGFWGVLLAGAVISFFVSAIVSFLEKMKGFHFSWIAYILIYILIMAGVAVANFYILLLSFSWVVIMFFFRRASQ